MNNTQYDYIVFHTYMYVASAPKVSFYISHKAINIETEFPKAQRRVDTDLLSYWVIPTLSLESAFTSQFYFLTIRLILALNQTITENQYCENYILCSCINIVLSPLGSY